MKKLTGVACILCLTVGILAGVALPRQGSRDIADTEVIVITISPKTIIIGSDAEWVTVHTNIPYYKVDRSTLILNGIKVAWTKSDAKGNLVAKFDFTKVENIVNPPQATLTLTGSTNDGVSFSGSDTVAVRTRSGN